MNSITRLILHQLASGKLRLTPQVIEVLKEVSVDQPDAEAPENGGGESDSRPDESESGKRDADRRLTFVNPQPGRWIRRTGCALGSALLLAVGLFSPAAKADEFEAANDSFAHGNYAEAARGFEAVVSHEGYSAPVLFNLANAQLQSGRLGPAILNYERAALLAPNDSDIAANLKSARQKAGVVVKRESSIQRISRSLTANEWFVLAAAAVSMIAFVPLLRLLVPRVRASSNIGIALAIITFAFAFSSLLERGSDLHCAVVTAPDAMAGISPVTVAQPVFKLRPGEIVTLQKTHGDFALIKNHAGQEGWAKAGDIERIIP
jgi:Tetratricopeptide repeat